MPSSTIANASTPPILNYVMHIHGIEHLQDEAFTQTPEPGPRHANLVRHMEDLIDDLEHAVTQLVIERDDLQDEVDDLLISHGELAEHVNGLQQYVEDLQVDMGDLQVRHLGLLDAYGGLLTGFEVEREAVWELERELERELEIVRVRAGDRKEFFGDLQGALIKVEGEEWWSLMLVFVCVLFAVCFCLLARH
ncbi:hypothetical protein EKO04_006535 [Ascochyta lentis]|uniref:Uncharacterized protein n=1 Tax=Ascochyta lentis TaxID=205686 RepID=A0A8H7IZ38_9PLEO|nr:hypothetical protein EKO04_006535 [Ascochyta lentis]